MCKSGTGCLGVERVSNCSRRVKYLSSEMGCQNGAMLPSDRSLILPQQQQQLRFREDNANDADSDVNVDKFNVDKFHDTKITWKKESTKQKQKCLDLRTILFCNFISFCHLISLFDLISFDFIIQFYYLISFQFYYLILIQFYCSILFHFNFMK